MKENLLQFVWKHRLFDTRKLRTNDGSAVIVLNPGVSNSDAGPDFFNARVRIGKTEWAGNVEVHQRASDWYRHRHHEDAAYDNVVLHVVKEDDRATVNSEGRVVPSLILRYPEYLEKNYRDLLSAKGWIACQEQFKRFDLLTLQIWFHALMVERLQQKTAGIIQRLGQNQHDWNETFYQFLSRNFGFKTNALPFELLAAALPFKMIEKHRDNLFQLEALLFGTAGLLQDELIGDDYFLSLREEYSFLYRKYKLKPVPAHLWKFMRLRPVNFPTIRIAQFAALLHHSGFLFSTLTETAKLDTVSGLFRVKASGYWDTHYRFNRPSSDSSKYFGEASFHNVVINTVVPFLFVYGDYYHKQELKDRALEYLETMPPEQNALVRHWQELKVPVRSAFDTQALIQLKNEYCNRQKCLDCIVGMKLVQNKHKNGP